MLCLQVSKVNEFILIFDSIDESFAKISKLYFGWIKVLFKYIKSEIDFRRKKFLQFNGNYTDFIAKSEQKIPNLVVIINSFDVFAELYANEADKLYEFTRECNKFGIFFVLTVSALNGIKSKLAQTFKTVYTKRKDLPERNRAYRSRCNCPFCLPSTSCFHVIFLR